MLQAMLSQMQLSIQAQLGALRQDVRIGLGPAETADRVAAEAVQHDALARRELDTIRAELAPFQNRGAKAEQAFRAAQCAAGPI